MSRVRWLVTGAGGQLGRSLRATSPGGDIEWVCRSRRELDIADPAAVEQVLEEVRPEVVINAAAFTQVDLCEADRESAWRANARGPEVLAGLCAGRALLVHVSTEYVFSGEACRPIPEDAALEPRTVYGQSKAAGERAVADSGCDHLIVRTQWLFGPGRNFVQTMLAAGRGGQPLRVVEDQLGRPTSTAALAEGLVVAIGSGLRGTVHIACEGVATWYDFTRQIISGGVRRGLTKDVPIEPVDTAAFPRPAPRPAYGVLDLARARAHGVRLPHWTSALEAYLDEEARSHA